MGQPLILASQSPRRQELLREAGYAFQIFPADPSVEEGVCSSCSPAEYVVKAAYSKARAVAMQLDEGIILAADTIAECDGQKLGKPADREQAAEMLRLMAGRRHRVLTGIALWHRPSDQKCCHVEQTLLEMNPIEEEMLEAYLESDAWVDKAGAFGYQDGLDWVRIIEGSETNVVGLPMERIDGWLKELVDSL